MLVAVPPLSARSSVVWDRRFRRVVVFLVDVFERERAERIVAYGKGGRVSFTVSELYKVTPGKGFFVAGCGRPGLREGARSADCALR